MNIISIETEWTLHYFLEGVVVELASLLLVQLLQESLEELFFPEVSQVSQGLLQVLEI